MQLIRIFTLTPLRGAGFAALFGLVSGAAVAQGLFSPVITVNDEVITQYELEQRAQFLRLLRAPGNPEELAREALIDDRLRIQAVKAAGIEVTQDDIDAGIEELSSRTDLSPEEFVNALEEGGVSVQTLRDFARANVAWRDLIRARFLAQARPTDAEIDRALGGAGGGSGVRVLLSEIIIPVTPQTLDQVDELAAQLAQITSYDAFSQAAAQYSAAQTRDNGGRMNWIDLNTLPPGLRPLILALTPGDVTAPIALPDAVALFQMRGIQESNVSEPRYSAIDYAIYYIPGGRSAESLGIAAGIAGRINTCDDLYGIAKGQPADRLERISQAPSEIPRDIAIELAKLDDGEISTTLTRSNGQTLMLLMLCGRTAALNEDASRAEVANALVQQRLAASADSFLDQLRADAVIIER
ncbi:peptidylprolyl isomerase [Sedimentitalea sp. JM2-8]|uniref:Parvulin-like PPIase n=1 Tax=Sedimentitalea xiamensis TaxID=3050037 RepID=A0ABT7FD66_9RHOB|nr:peptidylprolyl isomerase [Sedimentitalea xiamensis]MDK3073060.1 peptidylprolyl isomerase [Sedimentitalea xiamensis]